MLKKCGNGQMVCGKFGTTCNHDGVLFGGKPVSVPGIRTTLSDY